MTRVSTDILLDSEQPITAVGDDDVMPIKVEDLWDYIRSAKQSDQEGLKREYKVYHISMCISFIERVVMLVGR